MYRNTVAVPNPIDTAACYTEDVFCSHMTDDYYDEVEDEPSFKPLSRVKMNSLPDVVCQSARTPALDR